MSNRIRPATGIISLLPMHRGQALAYAALLKPRFKALRCGRRFGKTDFAKIWISQGVLQGQECAWFAPQHMTWSEVYSDLIDNLQPALDRSSKAEAVIKLATGGRLDFWTAENQIAGRGRRYHRVVIDEAAFAKDGDNKADGSMMSLWEKAIKPTLYDYGGEALVCSNSAGKNSNNFFYNICNDLQYGFTEFHATTLDNPLLPKRQRNESVQAWQERRATFQADLIRDNDPLVYAQEYLAEFVDWSGVAFFSREKLLLNGQPVPYPKICDGVFAVIDTASKTGTDNDGTAVTYFAVNRGPGNIPLVILDWDIAQIEGAVLELWLPSVFRRVEELAGACRARYGGVGAFIEDKNSGTILLQQAKRRGLRAHAIDSKLTAMGKDERAINVSGYVHRGEVKYSEYAFNKVTAYKQKTQNHLIEQVESFRVGDNKNDREDDALDTFCYGIAIARGNSEGF